MNDHEDNTETRATTRDLYEIAAKVKIGLDRATIEHKLREVPEGTASATNNYGPPRINRHERRKLAARRRNNK